MVTMTEKITVFVPNGEDRKETAILLVGTAEEFGIDTRAIKVKSTGFYISEELARAVYGDDVFDAADAEAAEPEVEETPVEQPKTAKKRSSKKTSGNRAAKTNDSKEE